MKKILKISVNVFNRVCLSMNTTLIYVENSSTSFLLMEKCKYSLVYKNHIVKKSCETILNELKLE